MAARRVGLPTVPPAVLEGVSASDVAVVTQLHQLLTSSSSGGEFRTLPPSLRVVAPLMSPKTLHKMVEQNNFLVELGPRITDTACLIQAGIVNVPSWRTTTDLATEQTPDKSDKSLQIYKTAQLTVHGESRHAHG